MQNKFKLNKVVSVVILLLVIGGIWYFAEMKSGNVLPESLKGEEYISGVITEVDNGCIADGWCLIEVDDKYWIIYNPGFVMERLPVGKIEGPLDVGVEVDVYAKKSEEKSETHENLYTIVGDEKYYIKVEKIPTEYKNEELGFSFISPNGEVYNLENYPFITNGLNGKKFQGFLPVTINRYSFSFAGATPDFNIESEYDCGALSTYDKYQKQVSIFGEKINKEGNKYVSNYVKSELYGNYYVAYFKLKKGPFPVLGFCAFEGISENDFIKVIDTVKVY